MKTFIFSFFLVSTKLCFCQLSQNEIKQIDSLLPKNVSTQYDDVEGILWVSSKGVNLNGGTPMYNDRRTFVKLYFGIQKIDSSISVMPLRIVNRTYREGWIFFEKVTYLVGDKEDIKNGTTKKFTITDKKVSRDTYIGAYVIEKSDIVVNDEIKEFIDYVISSKKDVKVRFEGKEKYYELKSKGEDFVSDFEGITKSYYLLTDKFKQ